MNQGSNPNDSRLSINDPAVAPVVPSDARVAGLPSGERLAASDARPVFAPRRTRLPGLIGAGVIAAAVGALAISSFYRPGAVEQAAPAVSQAPAVDDAGITAAVKSALAADPGLSALNIEVETRQGVVHLDGPAPDEQARQRAALLASAPQGVVSVENGLVVVQPTQVN